MSRAPGATRRRARELAFRWATGWMHAARRVVPPASRPQGVLLFDSSPRLDIDSLHVQALELGLRRVGFRTLMLAFDMPPERVVRAIRALDPTAFVFCGGEATLEVVGRLVYTVRQVGSVAPVFEYREAMPVSGDHGIPSLGTAPGEAVERLKGYVDSGRPSPWWSPGPGASRSPRASARAECSASSRFAAGMPIETGQAGNSPGLNDIRAEEAANGRETPNHARAQRCEDRSAAR